MNLLTLIALLTLSPHSNPSFASTPKDNQLYPSVPGEIVLRLAPQARKSNMNLNVIHQNIASDLQTSLHLKSSITSKPFVTDGEYALVKLDEKSKTKALLRLKQDARVLYAEPNYLYHLLTASTKDLNPNDPNFSQLWGMKNTGQTDAAGQVGTAGSDIHVAPVWEEGIQGRKDVKVAIIDTGIDYTHPDLKDNVWTNPGEIAGDGKDNDHDGFVDDIHGWNFSENTNDPKDDHDHGSHCAGVIGALGNNSLGVTGINWKVSLVAVKFLNSQGSGTLANAVQAIQYATSLGVSIMSNSWGGGAYTQALYDSIDAARKKGILFVAAAGNSSSDNDATPSYPASYTLDNIISVAATDNKDQLADFSNFGKTTVHVAAPGVQILSTVKDGAYGVMSGTSMATPHVAGIAALLLSANPSMTYAQIKDSLIRSSDKIRSLSSRVVAAGRVNVYNAIHSIYPPDPRPDESAWKDYSYSAETPHPYENSKVYSYDIHIPGAKYIRVVFDNIDTELGYDKISILEGSGFEVNSLSGTYTQYVSDYLLGETGKIILTSDNSNPKNGFKVSKLQVIY